MLTDAKLIDMLGRIGRPLGRLNELSKLYPKSNRLHSSLLMSYEAYLSFCLKSNELLKEAHNKRSKWYRSSTSTLMAKGIWKPVKAEFETSIQKLEQAIDDVNDEADLAEKQDATVAREKAAAQALYEEHRDLFAWLDPVDPNTNLQRAVDVHQSGTGEWIIFNSRI